MGSLHKYNRYWLDRADRVTSHIPDAGMAEKVLALCGLGRVLDVGSGLGGLVGQLLRSGCDAYGVDASSFAVARSNVAMPGRFCCASATCLPFEDDAFPLLVCIDTLQYLESSEAKAALAEMHRVCRGSLMLRVGRAEGPDPDALPSAQARSWWENACLEVGFRKAPRHYTLNPYASIEDEAQEFLLLMQKAPAETLARSLAPAFNDKPERSMDILRYAGARADAHAARYHWACQYIKPGDRVLDLGCGAGYGGFVVTDLTAAAKVVGVDESRIAVSAATAAYGNVADRLCYLCSPLPDALATFSDAAFEVVIAFGVLDGLTQPSVLLAEFLRVLTPGGRIIVCVPSAQPIESFGSGFLPEHKFAQHAGGLCGTPVRRSLVQRPWTEMATQAEWWLVTAMKSPLVPGPAYQERVFQNIAQSGHASIDYAGYFENPWLMHSMVNVGYRLKDATALQALAEAVMRAYPVQSCDYAAGLCVLAYLTLASPIDGDRSDVLAAIDRACEVMITNPMALRWRISLLFVRAKLLESAGNLAEAAEAYSSCAASDALGFGVHLATKTTEAAFNAGRIFSALGHKEQARKAWERGVGIGSQLLRVELRDILIDPDFPNLFNHGDGVREYSVAWDSIARCANGLHLLRRGTPMDYPLLNCSQQTEYAGVTHDLVQARRDLVARTQTLEQVAATLIERTQRLERCDSVLVARTGELVETRSVLVERSEMLERLGRDLLSRSEELTRSRDLLQQQTVMLSEAERALAERGSELSLLRSLLKERTAALDQAGVELLERTAEVVELRGILVERTQMLERTSLDLIERTEDLVATRAALEERTAMLETCLQKRGAD